MPKSALCQIVAVIAVAVTSTAFFFGFLWWGAPLEAAGVASLFVLILSPFAAVAVGARPAAVFLSVLSGLALLAISVAMGTKMLFAILIIYVAVTYVVYRYLWGIDA